MAKELNLSLFKEALGLALIAVISFCIADGLKLPQPYWATISAIIVMQSGVKDTLASAWSRLAGTAAGAVIGGFSLALMGNNVLSFGLAILLVVLICVPLGLREFYRLAAVTVSIVMLVNRGPSPWATALDRFIEVSLGILVAIAMVVLFNPAALLKNSRKMDD